MRKDYYQIPWIQHASENYRQSSFLQQISSENEKLNIEGKIQNKIQGRFDSWNDQPTATEMWLLLHRSSISF